MTSKRVPTRNANSSIDMSGSSAFRAFSNPNTVHAMAEIFNARRSGRLYPIDQQRLTNMVSKMYRNATNRRNGTTNRSNVANKRRNTTNNRNNRRNATTNRSSTKNVIRKNRNNAALNMGMPVNVTPMGMPVSSKGMRLAFVNNKDAYKNWPSAPTHNIRKNPSAQRSMQKVYIQNI